MENYCIDGDIDDFRINEILGKNVSSRTRGKVNKLAREVIICLNEFYHKGENQAKGKHNTPFIIACQQGHLNNCKFFVKHHELNQEWEGSSVRKMLNHLGYINLGYDSSTTALMSATWKEQESIVMYLLKLPSIDLSISNPAGWNVIHDAAYFNKTTTAILKMLLAHPTCTYEVINKINSDSETPLDLAFENQNNSPSSIKKEMIDLLICHGAVRNILE